MSYLKLFKTTQDHAVGTQSVNQASDNNDAMKALYDAKHALGVDGYNTGGASNPLRSVGRHDDPLIARTVARFVVDVSPATPVAFTIVSGPILRFFTSSRIGAGQWRINVPTPQLFGAVALVEAAATADRKATCLIEFNPVTGPCVVVSTWEDSGGVWSTTDLDFSLVLWTDSA